MKMELRKAVFAISFHLFCWLITADGEEEDGKNLSRGFNDKIKWMSLDFGLEMAAQHNKPMMILIHKSWCGACKALKPRFAKNEEIAALSEHFIMVNLQDGEEPSDKKFFPDGGYIPRILFADSNGHIRTEIGNPSPHNEQYKYYYGNPDGIVTSMKRALEEASLNKAGFDEL